MRTGEGKTLMATLPVYLNAIAGKGVHVVTVNDYLAMRDAEWMGKIYGFLGLTVGTILHGLTDDERRASYACDITRTVPVGGKFNRRQKDVYDIVLSGQETAIRAMKPGVINSYVVKRFNRIVVSHYVVLSIRVLGNNLSGGVVTAGVCPAATIGVSA
jgi:hypothetical protein